MHTPRQKNFSSKLVAVRFATALVSFIAVTICSTSCSKGTKVLSMKQSGAESIDVNAATDADGSTSGKIIRDATTTQVLNAGAGSGVDGSQVLFPAGALAIDATVTMGLGANVASSGFAGAVGAGSGFTAAGIPVAVSSNPPTDTGNSMQIILPGPSSSSLAFWLAGDDSWIVIFESLRVSDNGKFVSGVIPRSEFKVKNGKAIVSAKNFGTYQVVIPEKPVERRLELEGKVADIAAKYVIGPPVLTRSRFFNAAFTATISGAAVTLGERFKEYRFTLDGTKPSCAAGNVSTTEPTKIEIPASESKTLKAVVCSVDGNVSAIAMATYTADNTPPATPVIAVASRSFNMPFSTSVTQNATRDVNFKEFRYSFTLTSLDCKSGEVYGSSISIPAATTTLTVIACDLAGNASPSATGTYTYDNTAPTAPSVTAANQYSSNSTVTWNWSSVGGVNGTYRYRLDNNDLTSGATETTSLTIEISGLSEGAHTLYVQERDEAGNWSLAGLSKVTIDITPPRRPIIVDASKRFNQPFNTTLSQGRQEDKDTNFKEFRYIFSATAPNCSSGSVASPTTLISIPASDTTLTVVACDNAGNVSSASTAIYTFDNTAPTVSLTSTPVSGPTSVSPIKLNIQFAETVSGFDVTDIIVNGGTKRQFVAVDGDTFTLDVSPTAETVTAEISAGAAHDEAGNSNSAASPWSIIYDETNPTVAISSSTPYFTNASSLPVTVKFSEAVTGFNAADVNIVGAGISNFSGDGAVYSFTAIPTGQSSIVKIDIPASVASDPAGNANSAASQFIRDFDKTALLATITSSAGSVTSTRRIPVTITFSKNVVDFQASKLSVANGVAELSGDGATYIAIISPIASDPIDVTLGVSIAASTVTDRYGNILATAAHYDQGYDTLAPLPGDYGHVAISGVSDDSFKVAWASGADTRTPLTELQYEVRRSTSDNMNSVSEAETNGVVVQQFSSNLVTAEATGLLFDTMYWIVVIVKDSSGNKAIYNRASVKTDPRHPIALTTSSPERKTFYHSGTGRHWAFWYSGVDIRYGSSLDGKIFTEITNPLLFNSSRFTISAKGDFVFIAVEVGGDIIVIRGTIGADNSIAWGSQNTVYDGIEFVDSYSRPAMTIGKDGSLYVAAYHLISGGYTAVVKGVLNPLLFTGGSVSFTTVALVGRGTSTPGSLALVPYSSSVMLISSGGDGAIRSYAFDGSTWSEKSGNVSEWDLLAGFNGVNGIVYSIAIFRDEVYVGGSFGTAGGISVSCIAKWNGVVWNSLGAAQVGGPVKAMVVMGGELVVAGEFSKIGDVTVGYIAKWNGSRWSTFGTAGAIGVDSYVTSLATANGELFVGGIFTKAGGISLNRIAKWNGSSWIPLGEGVNGSVNALAFSGGSLYVGGAFTMAGKTSASRVAVWDGSNWSELSGGTNGVVNALAAAPSGTIYVGGSFTTVGNLSAKYIAKWENTQWMSVGSGVSATVKSLRISGSELYVGGDFSYAGGLEAGRIAKWNGNAWSAFEISGYGVSGGSVNAITVNGSEIYIGGNFSRGGLIANASYIARWNGSWGGMGSGFDDSIRALAIVGNNLYVGGQFTSIGGNKALRNIAKWDGQSWSSLGSGLNGSVYALTAVGQDLYAGGDFTTAGGVAASRVAKWSSTGWSALGPITATINGSVNTLAGSSAGLYVGGNFTTIGQITANYIARFNFSSGTWNAMGSGFNASLFSLAESGDTVCAGGDFTTAGDISAEGVACWFDNKWNPLGGGVTGRVSALAFMGTSLYVAAYQASGVSSLGVARWDTVNKSWNAVGSGINLSVNALAVVGSRLYAIGGPRSGSGATVENVAVWDGVSWQSVGFGLRSIPIAMVIGSSGVLVAGDFGIRQYLPSMMLAKANSYSVSSDSTSSVDASSVHLGYIDAKDGKPYYLSYNGISWSGRDSGNIGVTPSLLSPEPSFGSISIGTNADGSRSIAAWDRAGVIESIQKTNGAWGAVSILSTGTSNRFPTVPEMLSVNFVPVLWTKGFTDFRLGTGGGGL